MRSTKRERRKPSRHPRQPRSDDVAGTTDERVAHLHQTVGNQGVQRLVHDADVPTGGSPEEQATLIEHAIAERLPARPLTTSGELRPEAAEAVEGLAGPVVGTRVETDGAAIAAEPAAGAADAMTLDGDITLSPTVDPDAPRGREVLAHELAHVGQQRAGLATGVHFHGGTHALRDAELLADPGMAAAFRNSPPVQYGQQGDTVVLLQERLIGFGYHFPISTAKTGEPDGIFGAETRAQVRQFQRDNGLKDDGLAGHLTITQLDELGKREFKPLEEGVPSQTWTVEEYIAAWEAEHGREMTAQERFSLSYGCIGITMLNLGKGHTAPPLDLSFSTFEKARSVASALDAIMATQPTVTELPDKIKDNEDLAVLQNVLKSFPIDPDPNVWKAIVFSKRFWSNQSPDEHERVNPDDDAFLPDPVSGQVDMTGYAYHAKPGQTNFDYGWYDEENNCWWHANHAEPGMEVYQSTLEYYSRPLRDFDRQTFVVAFAKRKL